MSKSIRISDAAYEALVLVASREQRTVTAVVDRLMGLTPLAVPRVSPVGGVVARVPTAQAEPKSAAPDVVEVGVELTPEIKMAIGAVAKQVMASDPKCRKCGHLQTQHLARGCYGTCRCAMGRFVAEEA